MFEYLWNRGLHLSDFLYLLGLLALVAYIYTKWEQNYFARRGIKSLPFSVPFFAHAMDVARVKEHFTTMLQRHYHSFPDEKYVGVRQFNTSLIMIRDVEMLKQTVIKDFDHFPDHNVVVDEHMDSIFGNNLLALRGEKWRDMRSTLSPAFSSSKMRNMFQFMTEVSEQLMDYFKKKLNEQDSRERGLVEVEMKDSFTRLSNDIIASSAFGIKVNSLVDPNNSFYEMGSKITNLGGLQQLKILLILTFPFLLKLGWVNIFGEKIKNFYRRLVLDTMRVREERGIVRHDMIHLLKEAKKGALKHERSQNDKETGFATAEESEIGKQAVRRQWTDDDMVAQAVLFMIAGFDTTSSLMSFMAHELVVNQDVQAKLRAEVDQLVSKHGGIKLEYNDLAGMKYMDMVVSETLRKWPPAITTDRHCSKPYTLPPSSYQSKPYKMQVEEGLTIPIFAFHRDPKYFPRPEVFDPERFSEENKQNIVPFSFIPFGIGPRNCIGSRFALMEAKAAMFYLLANFELVKTAKTVDPVRVKLSMFNMASEDGFWMGLKPRF